MIRKKEILTLTVLLAAHCSVALGQSPPATVLTIDLNNFVEYRQDVSDPAKYATDPNVTTAASPRNFYTATMFADIVAVNGQPAKGLYVGRPRTVLATPTPTPGQAIADTTHNSFRDVYFEILKSDGTPIGSIVATGLSGGAAPPGAPLAHTRKQLGDYRRNGRVYWRARPSGFWLRQ